MRPGGVLAEDHAAIADHLRSILAADCDVLDVVHDGQALVEAFNRLLPDVVVTDIVMPVMSGFAAACAILVGHPDARIVFATIISDAAVVRAAMSLGALRYVLKQDAFHELLAAVRSSLEGRQYISTGARAAPGERP